MNNIRWCADCMHNDSNVKAEPCSGCIKNFLKSMKGKKTGFRPIKK